MMQPSLRPLSLQIEEKGLRIQREFGVMLETFQPFQGAVLESQTSRQGNHLLVRIESGITQIDVFARTAMVSVLHALLQTRTRKLLLPASALPALLVLDGEMAVGTNAEYGIAEDPAVAQQGNPEYEDDAESSHRLSKDPIGAVEFVNPASAPWAVGGLTFIGARHLGRTVDGRNFFFIGFSPNDPVPRPRVRQRQGGILLLFARPEVAAVGGGRT